MVHCLVPLADVTEVDTDVVPDYGELEPIEPGMGTVGEDCAPGYCLNDGSCYVTRKGINVCLCRSGYTGARCDEGEHSALWDNIGWERNKVLL